jgi:hypothetical protein
VAISIITLIKYILILRIYASKKNRLRGEKKEKTSPEPCWRRIPA